MAHFYGELKVFFGSSNPEFSKNVCSNLKVNPGLINIKKFSNGEKYVQFLENIRDNDVFLIQTATEPIDENLMELLIMIDAAKRSSAGRITAVIPFFFYARQDRKAASREAITARLVANLIETAGADRVVVLELHADQIQGFFNIPFDNLAPKRIFIKKAKEISPDNNENIIVSLDAGGAKKATKISKTLNCGLAIINKVRSKHNESNSTHMIGDNVKDKTCLIFDDIVDTAGSLCDGANLLKENGAKNITAFITHGIFSKDAIEKINNSFIDVIYTTNTLPQNKISKKIKVIDVSDYFAESIKCINEGKSVSELFEN